jgi:beta-lactamase regulating signal transducer with metallopeptidase domain
MTVQMLLHHPLTQALGWSLLHFLWQGALLALLLLAFQTLARTAPAPMRHAAACLLLFSMPVVFVATAFRNYPSPAPAPSAPLARVAPIASRIVLPSANASPELPAENLPGWAACLWLAGVIALSAYTTGGWMRVQRLKRRPTEPLDAAFTKMLESLKQRLQITRPVRLCASALAEVPAVIGYLRPVILLPVTALTGLDEAQWRAILAHELAHVRRHDYLVNLLQTAVETLLFYHPVVWWIGRQIRREREHCCDDLAIAACGDGMLYAGALARLEELRAEGSRGGIPQPALAATGGDLLARIRRLTNQNRAPQRAVSKSLGAIIAAAVILCIAAAPMLRQVDAAPQNPPGVPQQPPATPTPPLPEPQVPLPHREGLAEVQADLNRQLADVNQAMAQLNPGAPRPPRAGTGQGIDLLLKLYDGTQDLETKRTVLAYLGGSDNPKASEKVLSIARTDPNLELRRAAISYIADRDKSFDVLVSLYERDSDLQIKQALLSYLADSDDLRATDKLFSIAQSDRSPELRRAAIGYLAER